MTATRQAQTPGYLRPMERFRRIGGEQVTARIDPDGDVLVHRVNVVAMPGDRATVALWPTVADTHLIGRVDPDDPDAWRAAERLLDAAGWVPADEWTTIARLPAVRLRRAPWITAGTVPAAR